jgi:hypothetical protein
MTDKKGRITSRSQRLTSILNARTRDSHIMGGDCAWAAVFKAVIDSAARELSVEVHSVKPTAGQPISNDPTSFELATSKGAVRATRNDNGKFQYEWLGH